MDSATSFAGDMDMVFLGLILFFGLIILLVGLLILWKARRFSSVLKKKASSIRILSVIIVFAGFSMCYLFYSQWAGVEQIEVYDNEKVILKNRFGSTIAEIEWSNSLILSMEGYVYYPVKRMVYGNIPQVSASFESGGRKFRVIPISADKMIECLQELGWPDDVPGNGQTEELIIF